ncbi:hypothetical protein [Chlamydia sp. 17-3921]|uniref:hypothetical protein n=1 Tax=Chlamydia sp. 17-3921 TaxID=2675798 RepID=UPI0019198D1D|nr:hypothetical protein [Chlamydia sp. 17-3921]
MDTTDNSFISSQTESSSVTEICDKRCSLESKEVRDVDNSFAIFTNEFAKLSTLEEQMTFSLNRMEIALSESSGINLKLFWAIRKHSLPLFQQEQDLSKRANAWRRYIELTKEGRRIKAFHEEGDSFVIDQIELAISCLEKDINSVLQNIDSEEIDPIFLETSTLEKHHEFYKTQHASLLWLSSFSTKIIALRKELMNVGMRMKLKSEFFQRLSVLGNHVFPLRKELIEKVSQVFSEDVDSFVARYFSKADKNVLKRSVFFLRREIKNLQSVAKKLFVTSNVFSDTRLKLGQCWDQLKGLEKEIRQEQGKIRLASIENTKEVRSLLDAASMQLDAEEDLTKIQKNLESIAKRIRALDFVHEDVVTLKSELHILYDRLHAKQEIIEKTCQERLIKDRQVKQKAIDSLSSRIAEFVQTCDAGNITPSSKESWKELKESLTKMTFLSNFEKISLDNQLNQALQIITRFFENQLLSDSRANIENMRQVLSQRQIRRKELKNKLEQDKKLLGSSGLDFNRAMQYSSLVEEDKRSLEELDQSILSLKKQIQQIL